MADIDNEIRIAITLDDGSVREGFARIKKDGEDAGGGLSTVFDGVKGKLLGLIAAYASFEVAKKFIEGSIEAAMGYETALNNMNKSLSLAGTYTAEASAQFQELAKSIAATSTMTNTQALALEATARNYTRNNEQAKLLTKAAVDLAAATGKDASTAVAQLGATLDGTSGRLAKMVPELKSMTEMQLRSGDAIAIVAARFKDAAQGDLGTFDGTLKKLKNAFEELEVSFGSLITNSPALKAVLNLITTGITEMADSMKSFGENGDIFKTIIDWVIYFGQAINTYMIAPIEMVYNVAKISFDGIRELFQGLVVVLANVAGAIVTAFAPDSAVAQGLRDFADSSADVFNKFQAKTTADMGKVFDFSFATKMQDKLDQLKTVVDSAQPMKTLDDQLATTKENMYGLSGELTGLGQSFKLFGSGASEAMLKFRNDAVKYMQDAGNAASKTLAGGVATGMAAIGKALVKGQDIFAAFAGAMISAIGQACLQMGAAYLLMGIARVATSYGADATGWELIGVGAGMSVLGGALMAIGDGMSGSGSSAGSAPSTDTSGGGGGGSSGSSGSPISGDPSQQAQSQKTAVQVNIQGSVFDSQETGLRIVELVNSAFNTQGATVQVK